VKNFQRVLLLICISVPIMINAGDNPRTLRAIRISVAPHIDGVLDDDSWKLAEPATDFIQRDPEEGELASERSEVRVLYDDDALYFGCMFYDSDPAKIVTRLTRRDNLIECDNASIRIDAYHDHQTGYEFTFNPSGVKIDILQYDDANREDGSWDPVWEVQTRITEQGWTAEIRIPFRILRYNTVPDSLDNIWGLNLLRYISRKQESERWAFTPKSQNGFISRYGHLTGLRGLPTPRQLEVLPFVTGKQSYDPASANRDSRQKFIGNAGMDLKYGLSSNFTLDATINPDFGQVEADPAVLNLSTYETFYPEKRPFFIEGTQIIHFTTFGGDFGPGMFYSRRIGRALSVREVQVPLQGIIEDIPQQTTILGAAKLTGKTNTGLSIGVLQALTQEENATVVDSLGNRSEHTLEPFAHYNIIRLKQDVMGNSNIGMIITTVAKNSRLPAFTNGYDWNLNFDNSTYALSGFLALSHTTNSNDERVSGAAGKLSYAKIAAEHWLWSLSADFTSKKYNIDDAGFFFSPNDVGGVAALTYKEDVPSEVVRNYSVGLSLHYRDNFDGAGLFRNAQLSWSMLLSNYWGVNGSVQLDGGLYDQFETRGNGLYRKPVSYETQLGISSDTRNIIVANFSQHVGGDNKIKRFWSSEVNVSLKALSWMEWGMDFGYKQVRNQEAWVENLNGVSIFGDRSTDEYNFILRSTVTFTRELTLQLYGQVFLPKGHYTNFRQLISSADFLPYIQPVNNDFNGQSMNSNLVLRWEYLPGSTLFLVWSQARNGGSGNYFTSLNNNVNETFRLAPSNVFLLKASYWLSI
jgi:hypothetical protein